jgi:hypothetical protein
MLIEKGNNLYGLEGNWRLRPREDGLRVDAGSGGYTIPCNDPQAAYEAIKAGLRKGVKVISLDELPSEQPPVEAPAEGVEGESAGGGVPGEQAEAPAE